MALATFASTRPITQQINGIMEEFRGVQAAQARLHEKQRVLHDIQAALSQNGNHGANSKVSLDHPSGKSSEPLRISDGRGGMERASVMLERVGLGQQAMTPDGKVTPDGLANLREGLVQEQAKLGEGNQNQTLALQELMHQRDLFVQLATNTLAAARQLDQQILGNLR